MKKIDKDELKSLLAAGFIVFGFIIVAILESIWK